MTTFTIPTLTTDRLTLRAFHRDDFATYADFLASDRAKYMGGPYDESHAWSWFVNDTVSWQFYNFGTLAIEFDGLLAGFAGLIHPPSFPEPECGWGIYDGFTGKGIATEAGRAILDYAFANAGLSTIVSYIDKENDASQRVAARLGGTPDPKAKSPFGSDNDVVYRHFPKGAAA